MRSTRTLLVGIEGALDGVGAVKGAGKRGMQVDHAAGELLQKDRAEHVHPASEDNERHVGHEALDFLRQQGVIVGARLAGVRQGLERKVELRDARLFGALEPKRVLAVRNNKANRSGELPGRLAVQERLQVRPAPRDEHDQLRSHVAMQTDMQTCMQTGQNWAIMLTVRRAVAEIGLPGWSRALKTPSYVALTVVCAADRVLAQNCGLRGSSATRLFATRHRAGTALGAPSSWSRWTTRSAFCALATALSTSGRRRAAGRRWPRRACARQQPIRSSSASISWVRTRQSISVP